MHFKTDLLILLVKVKWKGKDLKAVPSTGKNWKGVGVLMNKEGKMRM